MDINVLSRTLYGVRKGDLWLNPGGRFDAMGKRRLWNRPQDAKSALSRIIPRYLSDPFEIALKWCDMAIVEVIVEETVVTEYPVSFDLKNNKWLKIVHSIPKSKNAKKGT